MKKLLIYEPKNKLKSTGGPEGYLYNLNLGLEKIDNQDVQIYFLEDNLNPVSKLKEKINHFPNFLVGILKIFFGLKLFLDMKKGKLANKEIDFNNYDFIHFHYTFDLYKNRNKLKTFQGKIILTSHSPKPYYLEYIDKVYVLVKTKLVYRILRCFEKVDRYAFQRADYIFFPCEEAEEPYIKNWEFYRQFRANHSDKYRYVLTGISEKKAVLSNEAVRKKYQIPLDAFVITYVGRHNEVKGYNDLKLIGEELFKLDQNIYVLCAGKEAPLKGLKHPRWIEVGWTQDPYSIIDAGDIFLLPNKETYFDIIFLEVLSLGKPILASNTGGNKHFKKYNSNFIELYENNSDAIRKIINFKNTCIKAHAIKKDLKNIFANDFNEVIFAQNYLSLIKTLK